MLVIFRTPPEPPKAPGVRTMTLNLTEHEVNTILHGLGALPYTQSAAVIESVREQISIQM